MRTTHWITAGVALLAMLGSVSCERGETEGAMPAHEEEDAGAMQGNRIAVPAVVRRNLGIEFVRLERRRVQETLRLPGRVELLPSAQRVYRSPVPGRIELAVTQFERVEPGDVLYHIESPAWVSLQHRVVESRLAKQRAERRIESFVPLIEAHQAHEARLKESVTLWEKRVAQLESVREAGGGRQSDLSSAQAALVAARAELSETLEQEAELAFQQSEAKTDLEQAKSRIELLFDEASLLTGFTHEELTQDTDGGVPRWRALRRLSVHAVQAGVVDDLAATNGSWVEQNARVMSVIDPEQVRVHAEALQGDLHELQDDLPVSIVPTGAQPPGSALHGTLAIGPTGNASDRTIELYVTPESSATWARPGAVVELEIELSQSSAPELAVPESAVQRDGLTPILFRRDPNDPDTVIRLEADLGKSDGRWVEVLSGVREGDEIVLDGGFQLMLATSGTAQKGGHFHADGTFHEEDH